MQCKTYPEYKFYVKNLDLYKEPNLTFVTDQAIKLFRTKRCDSLYQNRTWVFK